MLHDMYWYIVPAQPGMLHEIVYEINALTQFILLYRKTCPPKVKQCSKWKSRHKGRGADLDERNARVKGCERPLPLLQITTPRLRKTDVI